MGRRLVSPRLVRLGRRVKSNPAQFVVSVAVATLLATATWTSTLATGAWHDSTVDQIKSTAETLEVVRSVYHDDAPAAFGITQLLIRADALEEAGVFAKVESASARRAAEELRMALRQTKSLTAETYELDGHEYALNRRLGDLLSDERQTDSSVVSRDVADGDAWAVRTGLLAGAAVLAALTFVGLRSLGSWGARRARRPVGPDVGLVPQPWDERARARRASSVGLAAWLLLPLLTATQLSLSTLSERADAESTRRAIALTGTMSASQTRTAVSIGALRDYTELASLAIARQFVTVGDPDPSEAELGRAELIAAERWREAASRMTAPPAPEDGVDAETAQMLVSTPADWNRTLAEQHVASTLSERRSTAANIAALGILLASLSGITASMARIPGPSRQLLERGGFVLLSVATLAGAIAVLTA